jgi:hypothetical protein
MEQSCQKNYIPLRQSRLEFLATARVLHRAPHLAAEDHAGDFNIRMENEPKELKQREHKHYQYKRIVYTLCPDTYKQGLLWLEIPAADT